MAEKIEQARVPLWQFGDAYQNENSKPSPECEHPDRWTMMDEATPEVEVLKALHALIILCKPKTVLVVGDRTGYATLHIGQALRANGEGAAFATGLTEGELPKAMDTCAAAGLARWVQFGEADKIASGIQFDFVFIMREDIAALAMSLAAKKALIVVHGASMPKNLSADVSVLNLPTPRGLCFLQQ